MSCKIKKEVCTFQLECFFPTAANNTRPFSLYFYSSQGSQEQVVGCAYNAHYKCFYEDGFTVRHDGYNDVTITVPDTFSTTTGEFGCQKGDIPMAKKCLYPPPDMSSTSGLHSGMSTEGDSTAVPVGAIVIPIVVIVFITIIIIIGGLLLFKKYRSKKSRESTKGATIYRVCSSAFTCTKYFHGIKNTGNHVNQMQKNRASTSFMGDNMKTTNPIVWIEHVSAVSGQTGNIDQDHTSTDNNISGASSGLELTPSSSSRIRSLSDGSETPLI